MRRGAVRSLVRDGETFFILGEEKEYNTEEYDTEKKSEECDNDES